MKAEVTKADLKAWALEVGLELIGITSAGLLEEVLPAEHRPSRYTDRLGTVVATGKRLHAGIALAKDRGLQRLAAGNIGDRLDYATARLGYRIEEADYLAVLIPHLLIDWDCQDATINAPAGQGSLWARTAAVAAGLGTWGLNEMVLTRPFGPRVAFSSLLTDLPLEPDPPLDEELCLGLHACGRCAAVCPANAIPTEAPPEAPLRSYRGLDKRACISVSQPYGPDAFVEHIRRVVKGEGEERRALIQSPASHEIWQNMAIIKSGAFTGCIACVAVCPVGEDYQRLGIRP